jgi:ABC-type anion transport system duplicated permease subunit
MYEVFLNYVWYRYSLFVVLYQVVKVVLLIAENAALIAASTEARQPRGETRLAEIIYMILPSITMFILLFGGPEKLANQMVLIMPFMIAVMVSYRRYDTTRTASKIVRTISYIAGIAAVGYFRYWRQILVVGTFGISHLLFMKLN